MSAFLNPVRAADNIGASPDRTQEFDNGDDHPDKHDVDHCNDYEDDNIDKGEGRWASTSLKVFLLLGNGELNTSKIFNRL